MFSPGGEFKVLTTNKSSALALTSGRITPAALKAWEETGAFIRMSEVEPYRGLRFTFFGTGADNATITARLGLVVPGYTRSSTGALQIVDYNVILLGSLESTPMSLSTSVGIAGDGGLILSSERIADTLVWTAAGSTAMESADPLGGIVAYSPTNNTPGFLQCGNLRHGVGVILDLSVGTATNANAVCNRLP